jgi:hypothetical protein
MPFFNFACNHFFFPILISSLCVKLFTHKTFRYLYTNTQPSGMQVCVESTSEGQVLSKHSFEKLLLEAIDEGLSSLGDSAKHAIYFHLENNYGINRRDIPSKIEEFVDAIEKIFGLGAKILEILIMKQLYQKIGRVVEHDQELEDLVFTEYVATVRHTFLNPDS